MFSEPDVALHTTYDNMLNTSLTTRSVSGSQACSLFPLQE